MNGVDGARGRGGDDADAAPICDNVFAPTSLQHFFNFSVIALSVDEMVVPSSTQWRNGAIGDASAQDCS